MRNKRQWLEEAVEMINGMSAKEFIDSLEKAGFFEEIAPYSDITKYRPLPDYGELLTLEDFHDNRWFYDSYYPSDGVVYWSGEIGDEGSQFVLCLSK